MSTASTAPIRRRTKRPSRYDRLTHQEAIERDLKVMDATAFALARENRMPIIVFSIREPRAIEAVLRGKGAPLSSALEAVASPRPDGTRTAERSRYSTACISGGSSWQLPTHDMNELKRRMQGAIQLLKQELGGLRTGRASASLLEPVQVEAYGTHMPLNQVATVSVPEPRLISVQVWDKSMVHAVEKAIHAVQSRPDAVDRRPGAAAAHPGTERGSPQGPGQGRAQICRSRQGRVRHVRRDGLDVLKKLEKDHKISEDDGKRSSEQVQKATDEMIVEIDKMLAAKEKEILTV